MADMRQDSSTDKHFHQHGATIWLCYMKPALVSSTNKLAYWRTCDWPFQHATYNLQKIRGLVLRWAGMALIVCLIGMVMPATRMVDRCSRLTIGVRDTGIRNWPRQFELGCDRVSWLGLAYLHRCNCNRSDLRRAWLWLRCLCHRTSVQTFIQFSREKVDAILAKEINREYAKRSCVVLVYWRTPAEKCTSWSHLKLE